MITKQETSKVILVVEDDTDIGSFLLHLLKDEGHYEVVLVTDSLQALDVAPDLTPSLLMLNYLLPHMNGIQLYDKLSHFENFKRIPSIMLSASLPYEELKKRGIIGLDKPVDIDDLLNTIEQLISSTQQEVVGEQ